MLCVRNNILFKIVYTLWTFRQRYTRVFECCRRKSKTTELCRFALVCFFLFHFIIIFAFHSPGLKATQKYRWILLLPPQWSKHNFSDGAMQMLNLEWWLCSVHIHDHKINQISAMSTYTLYMRMQTDRISTVIVIKTYIFVCLLSNHKKNFGNANNSSPKKNKCNMNIVTEIIIKIS